MTRFVITITLILLLVMGGLLAVSVFGKRDSLSRQVETYDTSTDSR